MGPSLRPNWRSPHHITHSVEPSPTSAQRSRVMPYRVSSGTAQPGWAPEAQTQRPDSHRQDLRWDHARSQGRPLDMQCRTAGGPGWPHWCRFQAGPAQKDLGVSACLVRSGGGVTVRSSRQASKTVTGAHWQNSCSACLSGHQTKPAVHFVCRSD